MLSSETFIVPRHPNHPSVVLGLEARAGRCEWLFGFGNHGLEHGKVAFPKKPPAHAAFSVEDDGSGQLSAIVLATN